MGVMALFGLAWFVLVCGQALMAFGRHNRVAFTDEKEKLYYKGPLYPINNASWTIGSIQILTAPDDRVFNYNPALLSGQFDKR